MGHHWPAGVRSHAAGVAGSQGSSLAHSRSPHDGRRVLAKDYVSRAVCCQFNFLDLDV